MASKKRTKNVEVHTIITISPKAKELIDKNVLGKKLATFCRDAIAEKFKELGIKDPVLLPLEEP